MADFQIQQIGESWLLTPTSRASRLWYQSNLSPEDRKSGDGYVLEEQLCSRSLNNSWLEQRDGLGLSASSRRRS